MATPIPGFASAICYKPIFEANGNVRRESLQVTGGSLLPMPETRFFYFVSNRTTAANGQSFLRALKDLLEASLAGTTWTVRLAKVSGLYKIQISHDNGLSRTITFSTSGSSNSPQTPTALGFANATTIVVPSATTVTADYPSCWFWTPDMPVSLTGPTLFDPTHQYGVPVSDGASQRSSDSSTTYVQNGITWSAEYMFNGVQGYHKIRKQPGRTNEDLESWWKAHQDPTAGAGSVQPTVSGSRIFLWWRDRDKATGSEAPSEGSGSPWNYIVYAFQESLRSSLPATAMAPGNLVYWDVKLDLWVTEQGDAVLTP